MPDESTEVIEQKMSETRDALTLKVSALENQVVDTLQSASTSVSNMVDQVKTAVPNTIAGMKEGISEIRESVAEQVKDTLDVSKRTREKPWAMVGGAAALGFIAGIVLFRKATSPYAAVTSSRSASQPIAATASNSTASRLPGWLEQIVDRLSEKVTQEVRKLGDVAVSTASASLQQSVERVLPTLLGSAESASVNRMSPGAERNGFTTSPHQS